MLLKHFYSTVTFFFALTTSFAQQQQHTDVLVVGGSTGGTAAGIQSARRGVSTIIVEPTTMLGGMLTAAGVSCTDGNANLPSGIWFEFRQALLNHYQRKYLNTGWVSETCFEPSVGDSIFKAWAKQEKQLTVMYGWTFIKAIRKNKQVVGAIFQNQQKATCTIYAKIVVDATDLGDVLANAGAAYDVGTDDPIITGEKEAIRKTNIIQDLTWAAVLKDYGPGVDKTIPRPADYDSTKYFCTNTDAPCSAQPWNGDTWKMLNYGKLPKNMLTGAQKYMLNWPPHGNDYYLNVIEFNAAERNVQYQKAKQHTLGFIYFLQTQLGMKQISLADDELDGGLALIPYNREGRRLRGVVQLQIQQIKNPYDFRLVQTGIAVGDYPVDHHHAQYPGKVPEIQFPPIPSFNIPMGALIPATINGLIVCDKGISVSNIVNGTTRLQPVVLLTGQAAGMLAAECILQKKQPRQIQVRDVQEQLLKAKAYLMPFVDVKPTDPHWEVIQKIGITGILKGRGKAEGWANKTYFYPDSTISQNEFVNGLNQYFYKGVENHFSKDSLVTYSFLAETLQLFYEQNPKGDMLKFVPPLNEDQATGFLFKFPQYKKEIEQNNPLKRKLIALIINEYGDLFQRKIRLNGNFQSKYFF